MNDYSGSFDTLQEAIDYPDEYKDSGSKDDWAEVWDMEEVKEVWTSYQNNKS